MNSNLLCAGKQAKFKQTCKCFRSIAFGSNTRRIKHGNRRNKSRQFKRRGLKADDRGGIKKSTRKNNSHFVHIPGNILQTNK